jgi:tetratricopeptide (TPR) repeat protein
MKRPIRSPVLLLPLFLLTSCATTSGAARLPTAAEIPALESQVERDPGEIRAVVRLGIAYREANRLEEARATLERATALQPREAAAVFYLGLTYEDLHRPADARQLYERYLDIGSSAEAKRLLRGRLPLLERQEWRLAVREAIRRETDLVTSDPGSNRVAVYPFQFAGADPALRPLGRALAEMLATDLSQTDRLTVLERASVQALLDEFQLSESGLVDPALAVRGGRLLGAGRVIHGEISGDEALLRMRAAVAGTGDTREGVPLTEEDALRRLFDLQKRMALGLYRSMGIELTPAERERVMHVPTRSLEALLAYGHCLDAEDAADFARAARMCARAVELDPGFAAAAARGERLTAAAAVASQTTSALAGLAREEVPLAPLHEPLELLQSLVPDAPTRDAGVEVQGREGVGSPTRVRIILPRP